MFLPVLFHFPYGLIFIMRHQPCYGLILLEALRLVDNQPQKGYIINISTGLLSEETATRGGL
jgi:hypothetical protein